MVVMPMQPSPADLWAIQDTHKLVLGELRPHVAVLTRVVPNAKNTDEIRKKLMILDIPYAKSTLGNRVVFPNSMEQGKTVLDLGNSTSTDEVNALVKEIAKLMDIELKEEAKTTTSKLKNILSFRKAS